MHHELARESASFAAEKKLKTLLKADGFRGFSWEYSPLSGLVSDWDLDWDLALDLDLDLDLGLDLDLDLFLSLFTVSFS
jgi:hypothetical protein